MKLYHLLSIRNEDEEGSNVHHLNLEFEDEADDSIKLLPNILDCVQKYSEVVRYSRPKFCSGQVIRVVCESKTLSIMYEILRGWNMPALYEIKSPHQAQSSTA